MRVITFQSQEVLDILLNNKVYYADNNKSRENNDYTKDIERLNGKSPIWVFNNPDIQVNNTLNYFTPETWRCEMSLGTKHGLENFLCLEFELDKSSLKQGQTHNSYKYAKVVDKLLLKDLCCVYKVSSITDLPKEIKNFDWYFKQFEVIKTFNGFKPSLGDVNTYALYELDNVPKRLLF